jgi:hypothetical protein
MIDISSEPDGDYTICVSSETENPCGSGEAQDNCSDAEAIGPGTYQGSTSGANSDSSGCYSSSPDVWYSYTPMSDGALNVTTCGGASYDTALSIHSGCPGTNANQLACNDDSCGLRSTINLNVTAGETYLIRVGGFSNSSGSYTLDVTGPESSCGVYVEDCYSFTKQGEDTIALNVSCNMAPAAVCQDVTVSAGEDCMAEASIDGGSSDPDGDPITITQDPAGPYELGDTAVTLTITDDKGVIDTCTATVTVEDTTAPEFSCSVTPNVLWPPNHRMVLIRPSLTLADACDESPEVTIESITSNEPDNSIGTGDGNTTDDIQVIDGEIYLRSERNGRGRGRIYTITFQAEDESGNVTLCETTVTVPHHQGSGRARGRGRGNG